MQKITHFSLNNKANSLQLTFEQTGNIQLTYEYLRVYSTQAEKTPAQGQESQFVFHKKQVKLLNIEAVGKHGYRFIFDDNHKAIYSETYLLTLYNEHRQRWQAYLAETNASANSREASIQFKEV